jgi:hypothetical protein
MIATTCPTCGERLQATDEQSGTATRCRECGEPLRLPGQRFRWPPCPSPAAPPAARKKDHGRLWAALAGGVVGALAGLGVGLLVQTPGDKAGPLRVGTHGVWTVSFRPDWVGEWPAGENVLEANEIERLIEQRLQDGTFTSISLRPNVLVLGAGAWERAPSREREEFFTLFADYFDLKGAGSRYEIRTITGGEWPGKLVATYSPEEGLRPIRRN